ncbi:Ebp2-domain-containing protein [Cenococcum geophilum 1.58]|uniref:Ebp2-domain-containing protein n=1 Tax=Cenococcum geophilum 1.58 TaxID=794803 RepID=UPI00358FE318|nr:Ebp2-domain-containing protein [Cenococcum geophilum 1.58]
MAKSKLLSALDRHKGRDIKLEKQRKAEKDARKRKRVRKEEEGDSDEDEEVGGVALNGPKEEKRNGAKGKKGGKANGVGKGAEDEAQWETDEDESDEDEDDSEAGVIDTSRLNDTDSSSSEDEDIPLSDIESLASEDRGDILPHQRLTINNTTALLSALHRIQLPTSSMPFSEHQSLTTAAPTSIPDVEDDLNRELAFYAQSLSTVNEARALLKKEGVLFSRPADYFAEMVKSDEHMGKIKQKLIDTAAGKKAAADARRQRDLKKFGKQVQVAKLQERDKAKRETLEKINLLKRKRQSAELTTTHEPDLFDVTLDDAAAAKPSRSDRKDGRPNPKRQKKNDKFGFGGKKRFAKSGDAVSSADMRGFSVKRMREDKPGKSRGGGGAGKRLGKSRRAKKV